MRELQNAIGYHFQNPDLLQQALTHTSYANEVCQNGLYSYERLEFLGDSILGFTAADYLLSAFPQLHEGDLSKLRADLVCETSLAQTARKLNLGQYLRLGRGEEACGGREKPSIIADVTIALRDLKVELMSMTTKETGDTIIINCGVRCRDVDHANLIIAAIRKVRDVYDVTRGNF